MSTASRSTRPPSGLPALVPLAALLVLAACRDPATSTARALQDSVVVAMPGIALTVEVVPSTIAVGDTATVRVTATNRSTTPVALHLGCDGVFSYRVETLSGELAPGVSAQVCPGAERRLRFAAGEARVVEFRLPRPGGESTAVGPGEYRVRGTLGYSAFQSAPAPLVVTPDR